MNPEITQTITTGQAKEMLGQPIDKNLAQAIRQVKAEFKQMKKYGGLRVMGKRGKEAWMGKRLREIQAQG